MAHPQTSPSKRSPGKKQHRQSIRTAGRTHAQKGAEQESAGQADESESQQLDEAIMGVARRLRDISELGKLADPGVKAAGHAAAAVASLGDDDELDGL